MRRCVSGMAVQGIVTSRAGREGRKTIPLSLEKELEWKYYSIVRQNANRQAILSSAIFCCRQFPSWPGFCRLAVTFNGENWFNVNGTDKWLQTMDEPTTSIDAKENNMSNARPRSLADRKSFNYVNVSSLIMGGSSVIISLLISNEMRIYSLSCWLIFHIPRHFIKSGNISHAHGEVRLMHRLLHPPL